MPAKRVGSSAVAAEDDKDHGGAKDLEQVLEDPKGIGGKDKEDAGSDDGALVEEQVRCIVYYCILYVVVAIFYSNIQLIVVSQYP